MTANYATVAGGVSNVARNSYATVGGGRSNTASNSYATVAGGQSNTASGLCGTVGGGALNTASGSEATVGGGQRNTASGSRATVGGGWGNTASGSEATVGGGSWNAARGYYSFAAGRRAKANNTGSFAWADSGDADFNVSDDNRFGVRATGGVYLYTNSGLTAGAYLAAGSGTWASVSDRNVKENVVAVNAAEVLEKIAAMPISTWNYKSEDRSIRHIGPMAQDFHAAFGLGDSDKAIATIDADGVTLAAIQALHKMVKERDAKLADLKARLAALESR